MDREKFKKEVESFFFVREKKSGVLVNNRFVCFGLDNEDLPIWVSERGGEIVLSDMAMTCRRLQDAGVSLFEKKTSKFVEKVLGAFGVQMNEEREIFAVAEDEGKCVMAMGRLLQALVMLANIDLHFE